MKLRIFWVVFILGWGTRLFAQQPDMARWLTEGTHEEIAERLIGLGVEEDAVARLLTPANHYAMWRAVRGDSPAQYAILFLPCAAGSDSAHLYLTMNEKEKWAIVDRMELDCHYDESVSFDISSLRNSTVDEVLVHHACEGHGTGILVQNFKVFELSRGKFKNVLDTEEVLKEHRAGNNYNLEQNSTFVIVPMSRSHSRALEETRSRTLNDRLLVDRRTFRWDVKTARYRPSRFVNVLANVAP